MCVCAWFCCCCFFFFVDKPSKGKFIEPVVKLNANERGSRCCSHTRAAAEHREGPGRQEVHPISEGFCFAHWLLLLLLGGDYGDVNKTGAGCLAWYVCAWLSDWETDRLLCLFDTRRRIHNSSFCHYIYAQHELYISRGTAAGLYLANFIERFNLGWMFYFEDIQ